MAGDLEEVGEFRQHGLVDRPLEGNDLLHEIARRHPLPGGEFGIAAVVGEDLERTLGPAELAGPVAAAPPLPPSAVLRAPAPGAVAPAAPTPAGAR